MTELPLLAGIPSADGYRARALRNILTGDVACTPVASAERFTSASAQTQHETAKRFGIDGRMNESRKQWAADWKLYNRADTYTIEELKENIREMTLAKGERDARVDALEAMAEEHAELIALRSTENHGTSCLASMRAILGVKLMLRELGESDEP